MKYQQLISIITVVYNGAKTLEQTIQSVLNQAYKNIEYIIIDGGSTDGTLDIIKKYENQINFWISEPDKGVYDAMNKGIKRAKGELIGMINSDDWYEDNTLETIMEAYSKAPKRAVFHGDMYIHEKNSEIILRKFNPSSFKMRYYGVTYNHPTFFVTKQIYQDYTYNKDLVSVADIQFILEILLNEKEVFIYIPEPLANFRKGGISSRQSTFSSLRSGFTARKNAGFGLFENIFTIIIRLIYYFSTSIISAKQYHKINNILKR